MAITVYCHIGKDPDYNKENCMSISLDQLLPSLQALGLWSYWIIGLSSLLEAFLVTGIFIPGTLIVAGGGMLVQQGALDYFDLVWFVAIGSVLGSEASYWAGIWAKKGIQSRWHPEQSPVYMRAEKLFARHGGFALVLGRFLGPLAGFVSFSAAISGMGRKKFLLWNIASGFPFALVLIAAGYFLGNVMTQLGPMATRLALFAGAALLVLALLWWLIVRIEHSLPFVFSILRSITQAIAENPDAHIWAGKHPRIAGFMGARFDRSRFAGLTATLLAGIATYILILWVGSALNFLNSDPILTTDMRLANLAHAFWTPEMLWIFIHITALGDWRVVGLVLLAALALLFLRRRFDLVIGLAVALAGNLASVVFLKWLFGRPRPELAYFIETSGSFPSGHAAISVAFFGMLFYIGWRLKWLGPVMAPMLAVSTAFLIGLSRLYLIEHYLSDVLNGWLVGGFWLVIGIAIAEWWQKAHPSRTPVISKPMRLVAGVAVLGLLVGAGWGVATYTKPRNASVVQTQTETIANASQIFTTGGAPTSTKSVLGTPLEPINIVITAKDMPALAAAMQQAGWIKARDPGLASLSQAAMAALSNTADDTAPVTPYFWNGLPNDVSFQRPTKDNSLRERHHVRFWQTRFLTPDGSRIYVGAASFDNGLDWTLLHHIDPNIDAERDTLLKDLQAAGVVAASEMVEVSKPHMGQSVAGDPWFTDGKAALINLR